MPSYPLNNFTAPDAYLPPGATAGNGRGQTCGPATLQQLPPIDHVNIDVANTSIYWSIAQAAPLDANRAGTWQDETFMSPGSRTITRQGITGIRVRAAVTASLLPASVVQAQVTVEAVSS